MTRRAFDWAVAGAVATLGAAFVARAPRLAVPPFLPIGDYASYDAAARALTLVEPVVHAPWSGALALPLAMLAAAMVVTCLWISSRRAGGATVPTLVALAALLSRPDLRAPLVLGAPSILAAGFVWASVAMWSSDVSATRRRVWGSVLAAAAVTSWPPVFVLSPVVALIVALRSRRDATLVVAAMAVGVLGGVVLWAAQAAAIAGEAVSLSDVWAAIVDRSPRGHDPYVWPRLSAAALPAALAAVAALDVWWRTGRRWIPLAVATAVTAVAVVALPAWRAEFVRAYYWTAWPLVPVGLGWLVSRATTASGRAVVLTGVGTALVGAGLADTWKPVAVQEPQLFAGELSRTLEPAASGDVSFVAEDTRVDSALVAWGGGGHGSVRRLRRVPADLDAALAQGRTVLAAASGRSTLELWGFRFAPWAVVERPAHFPVAAVVGRLHCVVLGRPWRELPGLEFTGRLGVHVPPGPGQLEMVVVSPPPFDLRVTSVDGRPLGRVTEVPMALVDLPPVLWPGHGALPDAGLAARRVEIEGGDLSVAADLSLSARAPLIAARYLGEAPAASVCAAPLPRNDPFDEARDRTAALALGDAAYFAAGWHVAEGSGVTAFRWTAGRAVTLVPARRARAVRLLIDARPAADAAAGDVTLRAIVNGWVASAQPMGPGARTYEWAVPASVWVDGTNEVVLEVSRTARPSDAGGADTRELGAQVTAFRLSTP